MKRFVSTLLLLSVLLSLFMTAGVSVGAEGSTKTEIDVKWNDGYVGSNVNKNYKNKISNGSTIYRYTDVIAVPKAGTKISFVDQRQNPGTDSTSTSNSAYIFSEWNKAGTEIELSGTNVQGTYNYASVGQIPENGGMRYEFVTDKDNQYIRLCYRHEGNGSALPKVYAEPTDSPSTKSLIEAYDFTSTFESDGTVKGIRWFSGYASSETNTNGSARETKFYSESYVVSGLIRIPKAGTEIYFSLTQPTATNTNYNSFTLYKQTSDGRFVYDKGANASDKLCMSSSGSTYSFSYISGADNEVIRLSCRPGTTGTALEVGEPMKVHWRATTKPGTFSNVVDKRTEWPDAKILSIRTGAEFGGELVNTVWNPGYIGSQYHDSKAFTITSPSNEYYMYTDVITVPKAGTTVYFFDQTYEDFGGAAYASTSVLTLSHWKKFSDKVWMIDKTKPYYTGCDCPSVIVDSNYRVYCYTTTEDNENIRLCLRLSTPITTEEKIIPPIYFVYKTDFTALDKSTDGTLKNMSYTENGGKKIDFAVYLPKNYDANKQYTLVFDNSADSVIAKELVNKKYKGIVVAYKGSTDSAMRLLDEIIQNYPVKISDVLFVGGQELAAHLKKYENLRVANALVCTDGAATVKIKDATVKSVSDFENVKKAAEWLADQSENYYTVLEKIKMYAIGDSYFGGANLGQHQTWVNLLGNKYRMTYHNYGIGGNTVADAAGRAGNQPPVYSRFGEMPLDGDIYFLEGGRNDRHYDVPFGTDTSTDPKTFKGALNVVIKELRTKVPDALIVLVTPWSNATEKGYLGTNNDYADAMKQLAEYYNDPHIVCIYAADTAVTGIDASNPQNRIKYFLTAGDVSHLNVDGMNHVLPIFERMIAEAYAKLKGIDAVENQAKLEKFEESQDQNPGTDTTSGSDTAADTKSTNEPDDTSAPESQTSETPEKNKGCASSMTGLGVLCMTITTLAGGMLKKKKES